MLDTDTKPEASDEFIEKRATLRAKLLAAHAADDSAPLEFEDSFYGNGDSGQLDAMTGNPEVDELFDEALQEFVTFDWYNNDGGGGTINWDVEADKITINGYYNETVSTDIMVDEEF